MKLRGAMYRLDRLVSRYLGIDFETPRVNPASKILGLREALISQILSHTSASAPVMAVHNHVTGAVRIQFRQPLPELAHGQQRRTFDATQLVLGSLSDVEQ